MTVRRWRPLRIIGENRRVYLIANALTCGMFLAGLGLGLTFPQLSDAQRTRLQDDGTADLVRSLIESPWLFALTILAVNALRMGALTIVMPSMVVPFAGIPLFAYWAVTTGITLVPENPIGWVALIPHCLTLIVEFQAYLLLMLGVYLLGTYWVRPGNAAVDTHRQGYLRGLRSLGWLALPALALLVVGAIYEAFSLRYLVHPLAGLLL